MSKTEFTGLTLRVVPQAKADRVERADNGVLRLRLRAPAVEGQANAALVRFVADKCTVPRRAVKIISGEHHRVKVITVEGLSPEQIEGRLLA